MADRNEMDGPLQHLLPACQSGSERDACTAIEPQGFHIRPPPSPHLLGARRTEDDKLFQTIHMGPAVVDRDKWRLTVDGLVRHPFSLSLEHLYSFPFVSITAFHECYGSPVAPPTKALWRVGNVEWTGVRLSTLLSIAGVLPDAKYIWSDGLDSGNFHGIYADRYRKDLPLDKAIQPEVLIAYLINGEPLSKERGGPVRLIVPGWFGTNSTKWLCRISAQADRALGPYTTTLYNETVPGDESGKARPVWQAEPNSMIVSPIPNAHLQCGPVEVWGWTWGDEEIDHLHISLDGGYIWLQASLERRDQYAWQRFSLVFELSPGLYEIVARATSCCGRVQPLNGRRNHVHRVKVFVGDNPGNVTK